MGPGILQVHKVPGDMDAAGPRYQVLSAPSLWSFHVELSVNRGGDQPKERGDLSGAQASVV